MDTVEPPFSPFAIFRFLIGREPSRGVIRRCLPYNDDLFDKVMDYLKENLKDMNLAVDVNCGPGNRIVGFCKYFKKVIGVEPLAFRKTKLPQNIPNCEFKIGPVNKLDFLKDESVDLFISDTSVLTVNGTSEEALRVLKPGGCVAFFSLLDERGGDAVTTEIFQKLHEIYDEKFRELTPPDKHPFLILQEHLSGIKRVRGSSITDKVNVDDIRGIWLYKYHLLVGLDPSEEEDKTLVTRLEDLLKEQIPNLETDKEFELLMDPVVYLGQKPIIIE